MQGFANKSTFGIFPPKTVLDIRILVNITHITEAISPPLLEQAH